MGTFCDCHTAMERVLEARGGLNFILGIINRRNLALLFAEQLCGWFNLIYQQILSVQTTHFFSELSVSNCV